MPKKLFINLPKSVEHNIVYTFAEIEDYSCQEIILDFSATQYVNLAGCMYIICLCAYIHEFNAKKNLVNLVNIDEDVFYTLMNYGFFEQMATKAMLSIDKEYLNQEKRIKKNRNINAYDIENSDNVIMPIETILRASGSDFENCESTILNHFHNFYQNLSKRPLYNFFYDTNSSYQKDYHTFGLTIRELIKNIHDHSQSWGLLAIHAAPNIGTQIAFYDIGINIANSVRKLNPEFKNDLRAINWALQDGNTSKPFTNQGKGFTYMREFVKSRNGILSIRTGKYHIYNDADVIKERSMRDFPGTQIVMYVPVKKS